jgi:hypothetical protein
MIWLGRTIIGLMVVVLIGICVRSMVHVTPQEITQDGPTRRVRTHRRDIPGDDVIGAAAGAEPPGWTALDDLQVHRLLNGPS